MFKNTRIQFKGTSYFALILLSTAISLTTKANESYPEGFSDNSIVGGRLRASRQREGYDRQRYISLHNEMVEKYSKDNPALLRYKIDPNRDTKSKSLAEASKEYKGVAGNLKAKLREEDEELQEGIATGIQATGHLGKEFIESRLKNPEAKSFFLKLLDRVQERALNYFKR